MRFLVRRGFALECFHHTCKSVTLFIQPNTESKRERADLVDTRVGVASPTKFTVSCSMGIVELRRKGKRGR